MTKDGSSPAVAAPILPVVETPSASAVFGEYWDAVPGPRSSRIDVRNPIVGLPSFQRLADLSPEARDALVAILADIAADSRERAEKCWRTHKAPMAAYWKACSVYAGHIKRAIAGRR